MLELTIEGKKQLSMELDTGAAMMIVSERTWKAIFPKLPLRKSTVKLKTYMGEPLEIAGERNVPVVYGKQECTLPLVVVAGNGPSLFGLSWLEHIRLD